MPFKSDKQRKYLYSQKPEVAKKYANHSKGSMYARALRGGSQTQSTTGKKTGTGGSAGG